MIKRMKLETRRIASVFTAVAAVLGALFMGATPAQAIVTNCKTGYSSVGAWGKCLSGTTQTYRVNVTCKNNITQGSYYKAGNWVTVNSGVPSTIQGCGLFESFYGTPWVSTP